MTERAKVFAYLISSVCWTKGWGTTGATSDPYSEHLVHLNWLVDNGYLFHYRATKSRGRGRYGQYGRHYYEEDIYGLTKKGWAVAERYVRAAEREIPGYEIRYQFPHYPTRENPEGFKSRSISEIATDLASDFDEILKGM